MFFETNYYNTSNGRENFHQQETGPKHLRLISIHRFVPSSETSAVVLTSAKLRNVEYVGVGQIRLPGEHAATHNLLSRTRAGYTPSNSEELIDDCKTAETIGQPVLCAIT